MALLLSAAMVFPAPAAVYAEDTEVQIAEESQTQLAEEVQEPAESAEDAQAPEPETQAPAIETQAPEPETQAPAIETQAPEPETQAPAIETQASETQASETQASETQASETQASERQASETQASETQASETQASETQASETQASETQASETQASESESESETQESESESETEVLAGSFEAKTSDAAVKVLLPGDKKLPEDTRITLTAASGKDAEAQAGKVRSALEIRERSLSDVFLLTLKAEDKDGSSVRLPKGTKLEFSYGSGLDLRIAERSEGEIHFLKVGDKAEEADADLKLSGDGTKLLAASVSLREAADGSCTYAAAGLQNRQNQGKEISSEELASLKGASGYSIAAETYAGPEAGRIFTVDEKDQKKSDEVRGLLADLGGFSVSLADAKSTGDVKVVNLFADEEGKVNTESAELTDPMYGIIGADGTIDVTSGYVVVNIIAQKPDDEVQVPAITLTCTEDQKKEAVSAEENKELAAHLIVSLAAENGMSGDKFAYVPYAGKADIAGKAAGSFLAPAAEMDVSGDLVGAAYGKDVSISGKLTPFDKAEEETETEAAEKGEARISEQNAASAEDAKPFAGTLKVGVLKRDKEASTALAGVVFSLYEKDSSGEKMVYSWTSGDAPAVIPAGILKEGIEYAVREEILPAAAADGAYIEKLPESRLIVKAGTDKEPAKITADEAAGGILTVPVSDKDPYSLTYTHEVKHPDAEHPAPVRNTVEISVKDPSGKDIPGAVIRIETGTKDASGKVSTWKPLSEFVMPAAAGAYDFTDALRNIAPAGNLPSGTEAWFRVTQKAPEGMYQSEKDAERLFTYTYTAPKAPQTENGGSDQTPEQQDPDNAQNTPDAEGTDAGHGTPDTQDQGGSQDPADGQSSQSGQGESDATPQPSETEAVGTWALTSQPEKAAFTDAYQMDITSVQISYRDSSVLSQNLAGGDVEVLGPDGKTVLSAGKDYLVLSKGADGTYTEQKASGTSFPMPAAPVRIVLLNAGASAGTKLTLQGTRSDSYHFLQTVSGNLSEAPSESNSYTADIPALTLQSRAAATVRVSSKLKDGSDHLDKEGRVTAVIAGEDILVFKDGNPQTITYNSAEKDALVTELLKSEPGKAAKMITHGDDNADGYTYASSYATVTKAAEDASGALISAVLYSKKIAKTATVYVGKQFLDKQGKAINTIKEQTVYAALFDENGVRVTKIKAIKVSKHNSSSSSRAATFKVPVDVTTGQSVYYLREVKSAKKSTPFEDSNVTVSYSGKGSKGVTIGGDGKIVLSIPEKVRTGGADKLKNTFIYAIAKIRNQYEVPNPDPSNPDFEGSGSFDVEVRVVDIDGNPLKTEDLVASFKVAGVSGGSRLRLKNYKTVTLKDASSGKRTGISFPVAGDNTPMNVTLMSIRNSQGVSLAKDYTLLTASYDGGFSKAGSSIGERTFSLEGTRENQGPVVFVLRKNDTNEKASLTLTKSVMYKKTPIRVNATYYIGIFADKEHKKLLFKKAMTLLDASSMSDELKVNINSQKDHQITLYFAETDRNGKVVKSGKKTGYNITVEPEQVTLSRTNMNASVTVTNEIIDGSKASERLTDPDSGFAGDEEALGQAQSLADSSNLGDSESGSGKKTGDSTPIMLYLIIVLISGGAIAALALVFRRRRRR